MRRPCRATRRPVGTAMVAGLAALMVSIGSGASPLAAQVAATDTPGPAVRQPPPPLGISPGGAFLRAALVPGWGHAAIGSYTRGGFYLGAQAATVFTLLRARTRIGTAQDRVRLAESVVRARLAAEGVTDPEAIDAALLEDADLGQLRGLLESRKDQQEDLVALSIFIVLLSAADAYVSAHLARFPDPLDLSAGVGPGGDVEVGLRIRVPN